VDRPRIVLSTSTEFRDRGLRRNDSLTGQNYSEAVIQAGGLPLMTASLEPSLAEWYAETADGVLFTGGVDIDPAEYGQQPAPGLGRVDQQRDAFELALYRAARERGLPILGVCRGIQLINVAEGGTLHQHLPALPQAIQHTQVDIGGAPSHAVALDGASRLAHALGSNEIAANSYHHQAIDRLGAGLRAVGWTSDDLVEVVEGSEGSMVLGVQWHPEMSYARHPEHLLPFHLLVEAACLRRPGAVTV
jgi:putative glutamine amidotransferase